MKRRWVIPVVSAALALVTTLAVTGYLQSLRRQVAVVTPVKTEAVVFAKSNIAERRVVSGDVLELRQVPVTAIHPQAVRDIKDAANRVAVAPLYADEQVLGPKLALPGVNVGLAYVLPKDKRAMTIAVNEVIGVAGFVFPADRVDVVGTVTVNDVSFTKMVLQGVEVLAIAQKVEQKPGEEPRVTTSATLALTPDQTEVLAQVDNSGKVRLALRPYGVVEKVQTAGMTVEAALGRKAPQPATAVRSAVNQSAKGTTSKAVVAQTPQAKGGNRRPRGESASVQARSVPAGAFVAGMAQRPAAAPSSMQDTKVSPLSASLQPQALPALPSQISPDASRLLANMRLLGVITSADGSGKLAVILAGAQTRMVRLGDSLDGFTVVFIAENKVILRRGETMYEVSF